MIDTIAKMLNPMKARLHQMIRLGVLKRTTVSDGKQRLQILLGEDDVQELRRFQEFGFYSVPTSESQAVVLFPSGNRGNGLVIGTFSLAQTEKLAELTSGEVAIYNSGTSFVALKKESLEISHGTAKIILGENGKVEILSGGVELISTLKTLLTNIQLASATGVTPTGNVKFTVGFPSADSLNAFIGK